MAEEYMDFDRFIETFELKLDKEFDRDGVAASWAPSANGGPQLWGDERDAFELNNDDPMSELAEKSSAQLAISPDGKFMAVSTNAIARIFAVESKVLTAELRRHEETVQAIHFWKMPSDDAKKAHYVVLSQDSEPAGADGVIIAWYLDGDGARVGDAENSIQFEGRFLSGSASALRSDGALLVHSDRSITTQGWSRPSDWLPQLVIRSLSNPLVEVCRLKGHQDSIQWASWSPTDPNVIASASWDGSCRIWNAATGECIHNIQHTDGQNWTGDFSPNGEQIVFAGTSRSVAPHVAIYSVATGNSISVLQAEMTGLGGGSTPLSWSPSGDVIALVVSRSVVLWDVATNSTTEVIKVHSDGSLRDDFCDVTSLKWLDQRGSKLLVRLTDQTVFVWDRQHGWKWRLQRPPGVRQLAALSSAEAFLEEKNELLCLDGDWRIRTWGIE
ncbi:WD40/YVTN repeat-like-containing domain protein [Cordyceps fumosorosea ARSEF 2679]|uniref:WD40/YVTN repeat-like-containing domain protein n=1 Tax=Cordyceps fumosorosea (strain ARSEF 2679) TaxID=1081104 RepID=A0A162I9D1_CORFA|nr:WD40/YVTN repeat-like-containing domain protein [Cordyceps fumosorosea ARSEF 2679]OAA54025.1 WD40/YVTN repeat-like-containing domain protein [Cordyceps fumosorosea ARSEF 2679]